MEVLMGPSVTEKLRKGNIRVRVLFAQCFRIVLKVNAQYEVMSVRQSPCVVSEISGWISIKFRILRLC